MDKMILYHAGLSEIQNPDIRHGRKNADFGQGFYLTPDREFAERWSKSDQDSDVYLNRYELTLDGLQVKRMERSEEWFDYIRANRHLQPDAYPEADVIIGPIANDTIYDVLGITTAGYLSREESLALLQVGPEYRQVVLKTEKAASNLRFLRSEILNYETLKILHEEFRAEEKTYQTLFAETMEKVVK